MGSTGCPALQCYDPETNAEIEPKRFLEGKMVEGTLYIPAAATEWRNNWDNRPEGYLSGTNAVAAAKAAGGWYEDVKYTT